MSKILGLDMLGIDSNYVTASLNQEGVGRLSIDSQVGSYFCPNSGRESKQSNKGRAFFIFISASGAISNAEYQNTRGYHHVTEQYLPLDRDVNS